MRWARPTARADIEQRYFNRESDAQAYAAKLRRRGRDPVIYVTSTEWRPVR